MKVMVIGGGGREHALVWKLKQSARVEKVYCAPGNAGTAADGENVAVSASDLPRLLQAAQDLKIDLTVVGPEQPLTDGIVDLFRQNGLRIFGCSRSAARLEGSKAFTKNLMQKYRIPTAWYGTFNDPAAARAFVKGNGAPIVVKADGLAAGKGVLICETLDQALDAVDRVMVKKEFAEAGNLVVIEEMLYGEECSFLAFTDGETVIPMASSQDHKRIFDNDQGPNTGGMGAYSPAPVVTAGMHEAIMNQVMIPTVRAMKSEGAPYKGVLYAGIMVTKDGPKVLEFNARFGDPETQPLLFRMKSDLVEIMEAVIDGKLAGKAIEWYEEPAVCVVMAAKGYPDKYEKGFEISGIREANALPDTCVFHAGTALKDGKVVTAGGRVLGVTARGEDTKSAIDAAYKAAGKISWPGAYYRRDIGKRAMDRSGAPAR